MEQVVNTKNLVFLKRLLSQNVFALSCCYASWERFPPEHAGMTWFFVCGNDIDFLRAGMTKVFFVKMTSFDSLRMKSLFLCSGFY